MSLTPEQFNKLATKKDFDDLEQRIDEKFLDKKEFHSVMDAVVKKLDNIEHAFVSNQAAHDRFEQRISRIEKKLEINAY
ncbi:hypothetical protein L6270_02035 [Candidatus Parcubacteria bacterium]|nr:hypothetical protein [Patescibacteria group bacterium]MBU4309435.1 hypothetical protein [Patescibacteria group bacterium]MBU4431917.1 hypothetical protein [Patescibacteria group bacterium]MBU4577796.1 hypothetical protein [Patescibacteria group bacterium]MCG2696789.1 hypothetical protein [Candidatus Parcubacteria bacterium]